MASTTSARWSMSRPIGGCSTLTRALRTMLPLSRTSGPSAWGAWGKMARVAPPLGGGGGTGGGAAPPLRAGGERGGRGAFWRREGGDKHKKPNPEGGEKPAPGKRRPAMRAIERGGEVL